jgi:cobaltochelatase CobT
MTGSRRQHRSQQKVEELCAAAIRALTGERDFHIRGQKLHKGRRPLPLHAPHLRLSAEHDDFTSWRGAMDSAALKQRHSDPVLHRRLRPDDPVERLVFELLEQLRVENLASESMPGTTRNMRHRFRKWSQAFHRSGVTEGAVGLLIYTVAQICWSRLTGQPVAEETEDLIEATRAAIVPAMGPALLGIRRNQRSQSEYAHHALAIAGLVGKMIRTAIEGRAQSDRADEEDASNSAFSLLLHFDDNDGTDAIAAAPTGRSKVLAEAEHGYQVFTRQYDRVVDARSLVRAELLRELRERLDLRIGHQGVNISALSRQLQKLLATPRRDGWTYGQEEGHIDGRRLAQLVSSPAERRLFRIEQHKPHADSLISFLVDCSGSMTQHAESIAMLIDVLVRALELAGVTTEVLGFSTGAWNGGRPYRDWMRQGRPKNPGRLNEVSHMVFKDAGTNWRRARPDIAALLKPDLFREGIDGEAVDWACQRMQARSERRRILIVFSDGSPTDSSTNLTNDIFYLDNHLKEVVARWTSGGSIEIVGLGVGLDLSPYYDRNLALDFSGALSNKLFLDIMHVIARRPRR